MAPLDPSTFVGADPVELERIAESLRRTAAELDEASGSLTSALSSVQWVGWGSWRFGLRWNGHHRPQMAASAAFVRHAAVRLDRHAAEQRLASAVVVTGGGRVPAQDAGVSADSRLADALGGLMDSLEAGHSLVDALARHPSVLDGDGPVARLFDLLRGDEVAGLLQALDPVLDVGGALVDLVTDFVEHPELALDERLVHAFVDMGARVALDVGVEHGATVLAGLLMPVILPGVGATLTPLVTKGVGMVVGDAMTQVAEALDGRTDIIDDIADVATDAWRTFKAEVGVLFDLAEAVGDLVADSVDLGVDAADALIGAGGSVVGAVGGALGSMIP